MINQMPAVHSVEAFNGPLTTLRLDRKTFHKLDINKNMLQKRRRVGAVASDGWKQASRLVRSIVALSRSNSPTTNANANTALDVKPCSAEKKDENVEHPSTHEERDLIDEAVRANGNLSEVFTLSPAQIETMTKSAIKKVFKKDDIVFSAG